ncbi:glycoside hydrolase family 32 protein [Asaia astilbis]|uniref:glycoside hydrolase family 32 protein n=1 Tax=Asaia astilbis TaxID=610244 RepID=UPI00046ECBBE|nr:glycoside hydrolase family 32 protein [Asaia astilbis]
MAEKPSAVPGLSRRKALASFIVTGGGIASLAAARASEPGPVVAPRAPEPDRKAEPNASHPSPADQPGATAHAVIRTRADAFYRPILHYTPEHGFMNDPCGLVYDGKTFHLYYQYDPFAPYAGHVHWGHATSQDLLTWEDQPIAINETTEGEVYTGCAVMDGRNSSGLFPSDKGGLAALYTRATPKKQTQHLAISNDGGKSFKDVAHNPVLDISSNSFRDPKVIFHEPTGQWVMVVAKARLHKIAFYASIDLQRWTHLSDFGPSGIFGVDYECPNLIEIPVEGGGSRWVLFISVNPGSPTGGSTTQYFVGSFDGSRFTPDDTVIGLIDFAKDAYALQCFENMPGKEAVAISWLSNWQYCQELPTQSWRGCMTLPRNMTLRHDAAGWLRLAQAPRGLETLREAPIAFTCPKLAAGASATVQLPMGTAFELALSVTVDQMNPDLPLGDKGRTGRFVIVFGNDQGESLTIGFDAFSGQLWIDRGDLNGFKQPFFTGQFSTVLNPEDRHFDLRLVLDACTLEVFANNGLSVGTALIFPANPLTFLKLEATGAGATIETLALYRLKKVMPRETALL